jgi:hypothetical protein
MPEHNGDYSPEAEYTRKMKREKVQRARARKRIEEGRATEQDRAAIDAWERGDDWQAPTRDTAQPVGEDAEQDVGEEASGSSGWLLVGAIGAAMALAVIQGVRQRKAK